MAALADLPAAHPALQLQAELLARPITVQRRMADAVRALAIDMGETVPGRHAGMAMGLADAATALWTQVLKFDSADPDWPDRDRFVMSAGQGGALLQVLLYLTGHPHADPTVPATAHAQPWPPGQGFAAAVGMALGERLMAARFGKSLVDHRTWVVACDGDLAEGLSHEAASLAGHLRLEKLTVLYDDSGAILGAPAAQVSSDDVLKRFSACGWAVQRANGHDLEELDAALSFAARARKPTLIALRTIIGFGAPNRAGTPAIGWGPLGLVEASGAKHALGWDEALFGVPDELAGLWAQAGARGSPARRAWLKRLARHPLRAEFERVVAGRLPETWHEAIAAVKTEFAGAQPLPPIAAGARRLLAVLAEAIPEFVGGLTNHAETHMAPLRGAGMVAPGSYGGRTILFGHRQHVMAAAGNGLALHGGILHCGAAELADCDIMRPALRLAAAMRRRVVHVLTEADGDSAWRDVEQLAGLRAMPGLFVFRPADGMETAECWELALRRADGPSVIVLARADGEGVRADAGANRCARGGYRLAGADGACFATLIATGSEVATAMQARQALAAGGHKVAVVSLPCWELFAQQDPAWQAQVLGEAPRLGLEAGSGFGWERWLGSNGAFLGLDRDDPQGFPESSGRPAVDAVVAAVLRRVDRLRQLG